MLKSRNSKRIVLWNLLVFLFINSTIAQPSHDPSHMVKDGGRYWIYTTGDGIWNMSASNAEFTDWRAEDLVFSSGTWPTWINTYVSGFGGTFWAPEIIYMNDAWYLYYSCSTFGSQNSAIGVVTSTSLVSPDWQDLGMVVKSPGTWNVNAIDPDIYRDKDGKAWLLYGSWWDGIVVTEIDTATGKPLDANDLHIVANNSCEAGNVISHGDYYYLFFNRGSCCSGVHSTYHILMGRSSSPSGPFYDKDSVATHQGGGSLFLHSDGRYIGPGHFGLGEGKLTYHYYDGLSNGDAKLGITTLDWEDDWPVAVYTNPGGLEGTWLISNYLTKKVLGLQDSDTTSGTNVAQYTETRDSIQQWQITYVGDGFYKISPLLAPDNALEVNECSTASGANIQIGKYEAKECQHWYVAYYGGTSAAYRIMANHSRKAVEIANSSSLEGANAQQKTYSNTAINQRWKFKDPTVTESTTLNLKKQNEVTIFPNPSDGSFTLNLTPSPDNQLVDLKIYTISGELIYSHSYLNENTIVFTEPLDKGIYLISLTTKDKVITQKHVVR